MQRPRVLASMIASSVVAPAASGVAGFVRRRASSLGGVLSIAPAALALRGGELAGYHGAEHVSIGSYEHGEPRAEGARALRVASRRADARSRLRSATSLAAAAPRNVGPAARGRARSVRSPRRPRYSAG